MHGRIRRYSQELQPPVCQFLNLEERAKTSIIKYTSSTHINWKKSSIR